MGQALYRRRRPRSFDQVVGQDHIVKTLSNALKNGQISHAYLFTGPRGVGKTSVARVLAHEINDLSYNDESIHLDIIEIDAASNRRIDEIRELRQRVHIAPTSAKYKVYIIDEVHMLTREAFNALLKTLEEPPAHCVFILATTEAHKLPETIISRTQRFSFKPIDHRLAVAHLSNLAKEEKIDITAEALELLAEHGSGSFRDSISLLDQLSGLGGKIDEHAVRNMLGLPPATAVDSLLAAIAAGNSQEALKVLDELKEQGASFALLAKLIGQKLRLQLVEGQVQPWTLKLLRQLSSVAASADPQETLEIDILEATSSINKPATTPAPDPPQPEPDIKDEQIDEPEKPTIDQAATQTGKFDLTMWPQVVDKVKAEAASLYTALRLAQPRLEDNKLILAFQFPLHQKKIALAKSVQLIGQIIEQISGDKLAIECIVDKDIKPAASQKISVEPASDKIILSPSLQTISSIFGAAEMLES